jgi:hypothetical protein
MKTAFVVAILATADGQPPHWYQSPEWVLVIVGIITFLFIGWQSWETRRAAEATRMNAEVFWASQRAQIVAEPHDNPAKEILSDTPRVQLELTNKGMTPAYDVVYETWIEILPRPFVDFTPGATYFKSPDKATMYPDTPIVINIPLGRDLTQMERTQIKSWDLHTCVRIRAEYRDAREPDRYADFGFHVLAEGLRPLGKFKDAN